MDVQAPHDKLFKSFFSHKNIAKNFLENYLPEEIKRAINFDTLYLENATYVDKELQESFSDMLYIADINQKEGYLYFLFEHKSYQGSDISLQLLKYMVSIWTKANKGIKGSRLNKLPVIIPIVIYHGQTKWDIEKNFKILIKEYETLKNEIQKYIPDYEYLVYDISSFTDDEIKGAVELQILMKMFKAVSKQNITGIIETLVEAGIYFERLEEANRGVEYFEILINYLFGSRVNFTKENLETVIKKIENTYPKGSDIVNTLAEIFREEGIEKGRAEGMALAEVFREEGKAEGIAKGIVKGKAEGKAEGRAETLIKLYAKKLGTLPTSLQDNIKKASLSTLDELEEAIFEINSIKGLEEIFKE